jgi:hypothetical protein
MTDISRALRFAVPALALLAAACSDTRSDQPTRLSWDPASTTYEGSGTNGGTDVDGAGPGGPRDPRRLVMPNPYARAVTPAAPNVNNPYATDSMDPDMNPHDMREGH